MRKFSFTTRRGAATALAAAVGIGAVVLTIDLHTGPIMTRAAADVSTAIDPASCTTGLTPAPGFVLDLCLTGHGSTVTPAVIVEQVGYIASSCQITLGVFDGTNNRIDHPSQASGLPCTAGEHDGTALDLSQLTGITVNTAPDGSMTVHASADLTVDGQETNLGASPTYTYNPDSPSPSPATAPTAANARDDYPKVWKNQDQDAFSNAFGLNRECVSFVAWKIYEANGGTEMPKTNQAPGDYATYSIDVRDNWGDAYAWGSYARAHGSTVSSTPTAGSVAWWDKKGVWAAHGTGHVAYVTAVQTDDSGNVTGFDIAQYNIEGYDGSYSTAHFTVSNGHLVSVTNTTPASYPLADRDFSWIPMPDGFISNIRGGE
jgi:surface antigen